MHFANVIYIFFIHLTMSYATDVATDPSPAGPQSHPQPQAQPAYNAQPYDTSSAYVASYSPSAIPYGYEAGYGVQNPSVYDYMLPQNYPVVKNEESGPVEYMGGILPVFKALTVMLKIAGKLGLFLIAGIGILFVGMAFTTAVCTLTPLCTITFLNGYGVSEETVRALLTPDKITATAHFVREAMDKYQKMQDAINDP